MLSMSEMSENGKNGNGNNNNNYTIALVRRFDFSSKL